MMMSSHGSSLLPPSLLSLSSLSTLLMLLRIRKSLSLNGRKRSGGDDLLPSLSWSSSSSMDRGAVQRYVSFDPFPSLAKDFSYSSAARRQYALSRLPNKRGTSYGEISKLQASMHTVEPQSEEPIKKIYMCHVTAERFKESCSSSNTNIKTDTKIETKAGANRCALLFGTLHKERVE